MKKINSPETIIKEVGVMVSRVRYPLTGRIFFYLSTACEPLAARAQSLYRWIALDPAQFSFNKLKFVWAIVSALSCSEILRDGFHCPISGAGRR